VIIKNFSKQIFPREALDWIKLTGRQKLASFLYLSHSEGGFMIANAVCANDVSKLENVMMPLKVTSTIATILDFPSGIMQIHG